MHKGLTHATLGVLGAALLSGSVFAAGPTLKDLPDVIISDKLKEAVVAEKNANSDINIYDEETDATEDRYRFTEAFNLADYIDSYDGTAGDSLTSPQLSEIRYLFAEFADSARTSVIVSTETIRINGIEGVDAVPDYATVSSSSLDVFGDGVLDFVNQDRSGSIDATVPNPTPIVGAFTDIAYLTMYVASPESTNPDVSTKDFRVFTTNDVDSLGFLGDALSAPTSIYTSELAVDDFQGWYTTELHSLPQFQNPAPGMFTRTQDAASSGATFNPVPSVTSPSSFSSPAFDILVAPAATNTVSISTLASPGTASGTTGLAPQFGSWASWRRDHDAVAQTVLTSAGRVYLTRWTVTGSSISAPQAPKVRFRVGEATDYGIGQISDELVDNGANAVVGGPKEHLTYYYAHAAGEIGFLIDVFDYYQASTAGALLPNGQANYTITLDKVEVASLNPADLGAGTVEFNEGGAVTLASGEVAPPSGEVAFDTTANTRYLITDSENLNTGDGRQTVSLTASQGSFAYIAGNNGVLGAIQPYWVAANTGNEVINNMGNDELIRIDVWLSSPQGGTANNNLPIVRFGAQTDAWGESGQLSPTIISQGRTMYHTFRGSNRNGLDVGETVTPVMALQSGARRYSMFFTPNLHSGASTADVRPTVECYSFPLFSATENADQTLNPEPFMAGTVLLHRIVVTKYALPAGSRTN